ETLQEIATQYSEAIADWLLPVLRKIEKKGRVIHKQIIIEQFICTINQVLLVLHLLGKTDYYIWNKDYLTNIRAEELSHKLELLNSVIKEQFVNRSLKNLYTYHKTEVFLIDLRTLIYLVTQHFNYQISPNNRILHVKLSQHE